MRPALIPSDRKTVFRPQRAALLLLLLMAGAGCASRRVALLPGPAAPDDWSVLGGNAGNCGQAREPLDPSQITGLVWRRRTSGVASTEPLIRGGRLYLGTHDRCAEVFDPGTGDRLGRLRFKGPVTGIVVTDSTLILTIDQDQKRLVRLAGNPLLQDISFPIPAASTAPRYLPDGSIIIGSYNGQLSRYDTSGTPTWTVDCKGPIIAAPSMAESVLYVSAGKSVSARLISDGKQIWSHRASGAVMAAPAIDDRAYFGSTDSLVYAVNLRTGALEWFFSAEGQIVASPTVGRTRVFVPVNDKRICALDKQTGDTTWTYQTGAPLNQEMTLAGDLLVVGTLDGKLLLINALDGKLVREFALAGPCAAPPVTANGRVYICDTKRWLYCFGTATKTATPSAFDWAPEK